MRRTASKHLTFGATRGTQLSSEILDDGSAYLSANPHSFDGYREDSDGEECEYLDTDLHDPDEETFPPGEMFRENASACLGL